MKICFLVHQCCSNIYALIHSCIFGQPKQLLCI
uniref:Uncharacterized protein n=1 Tax=Arundo donax TaxID=35708 RepID=A0A0A9B087_ARUDO